MVECSFWPPVCICGTKCGGSLVPCPAPLKMHDVHRTEAARATCRNKCASHSARKHMGADPPRRVDELILVVTWN